MKKRNRQARRLVALTAIFSLIISLLFVSMTSCRNEGGAGSDSQSTPEKTVTTAEQTTSPVTTEEATTEVVTTDAPTTRTETTEAPKVTTEAPTTEPITETRAPETTIPPIIGEKSGVFHADTGTSLGFRVEWELIGFEGNMAVINTKVILSTYQLYISARNNLGVIKFGDSEVRFSTARITQDQNKRVDVLLCEKQVKIETDNGYANVHFEVRWFFNANYAGTDYEWIGAGGYIALNKES